MFLTTFVLRFSSYFMPAFGVWGYICSRVFFFTGYCFGIQYGISHILSFFNLGAVVAVASRWVPVAFYKSIVKEVYIVTEYQKGCTETYHLEVSLRSSLDKE